MPCYDKRSSFYAQILGVRLHRAGHEFLGRYTVPREFFVASKKRGHVAAWEAAQAGLTPFGIVKGWLTKTALDWLKDFCGSLALAILILVLLVRGCLSPFSFKADLDQFRRQLLGPKIRELRNKFPGDPGRVQRERPWSSTERSSSRRSATWSCRSVSCCCSWRSSASSGKRPRVPPRRSGSWTIGQPDAPRTSCRSSSVC